MSDISDNRYAYELVEGLSLSTNYGSGLGSLSPITRGDVGLRRPSSLSHDNLNKSVPRNKKQKLSSPVEGNDGEGSIFDDDDFGGKGKDKFLPFEENPIEAKSKELNWDNDIDDIIFSPDFQDLNFDSFPIPVSSEDNFESTINESPEGSLTVLQNSYVLPEAHAEATGTFASPPNLASLPHAPVEAECCEGQSVCGSVAEQVYNEQEPTTLNLLVDPTSSTNSADFVLYNTPETGSILIPRILTEYQDDTDREAKKKQLATYCTLTSMRKDITTILDGMATASIYEEGLCEFVQSAMDKWQNLKKIFNVEVVDSSPQLQTPVSNLIVPETDSPPMMVEGYLITRSTWAAAYPHIDIKNAAVDLFEELFTDEEKRTVTLSGRVCSKDDGTKGKTPRLDPKRLNVINHAIASMMKKKSTYHYCVDDFKDLRKTDFKAIKEGLSQRVNQVKQAQKKASQSLN